MSTTKKLKLPRGKVTIETLLAKDGIRLILDQVLVKLMELDGIIILTRIGDQDAWYSCGLTDAERVFMLERLKANILKDYIGDSE